MSLKERLKNWWINFRLRNFGIDYDWGHHPSEKNKIDGINFVFRNWVEPGLESIGGVKTRHHHPTAMYIDNMFESGPSTTYNLFYFMQLRIDLARAASDPWFWMKRFMRFSDDQIARLNTMSEMYGIRTHGPRSLSEL